MSLSSLSSSQADTFAVGAADELRAIAAAAARARRTKQIRDAALGFAGVALFVLAWQGVKALGGADSTVFGWRMPISTDDASMPHLWTVLRRFAEPEVRGNGRTVFAAVVSGMWFSFRLAIAGFVIGVMVGLLLAVVMQRFTILEDKKDGGHKQGTEKL